jgi:hypothetical protein
MTYGDRKSERVDFEHGIHVYIASTLQIWLANGEDEMLGLQHLPGTIR